MCEHNVYNIYGRVCVWHAAFVACVLAVGWIIGICGRVYNHGTCWCAVLVCCMHAACWILPLLRGVVPAHQERQLYPHQEEGV